MEGAAGQEVGAAEGGMEMAVLPPASSSDDGSSSAAESWEAADGSQQGGGWDAEAPPSEQTGWQPRGVALKG